MEGEVGLAGSDWIMDRHEVTELLPGGCDSAFSQVHSCHSDLRVIPYPIQSIHHPSW